jgi:2-dehydropantoate 2-reductase
MKHAILGAGAIGGLVGTALASLGEEVIVIVRPERLTEYPKRLTLESPQGTITAPARAAATLSEPVDVLWIATKTFQLQAALRSVETKPAMVIPLLNGIEHMSFLRSIYGKERVVAGTIAIEAERAAPGVFIQRAPSVRLNLGIAAEPKLGKIVAKLGDLGIKGQFIANEETLLWSKLCFLGPLALVTSASGKDKGGVFADPHWKGKLDAAIEEACEVGHALGAEVDAAKIRMLMANAPDAMRSSMQKDVAAGRPTELDAIGGAVVRSAEQQGIDVPATRALMAEIVQKVAA